LNTVTPPQKITFNQKMTQQQKQRERPEQAQRNVGEIVIATLDLLLGLPPACFLALVIRQTPAHWLDSVIYGPMLLMVLGMVGSGLLLLLRLRSLARAFQWLAALGGLGLVVEVIWNYAKYPDFSSWDRWIVLGGCVLVSLGLILAPLGLRKMEKD
jgi:hypothetical protein